MDIAHGTQLMEGYTMRENGRKRERIVKAILVTTLFVRLLGKIARIFYI